MKGTERPGSVPPVSVFLDPTGRRKRWSRLLFRLTMAGVAAYVGLLAASLIGDPHLVGLVPRPSADTRPAARVPASVLAGRCRPTGGTVDVGCGGRTRLRRRRRRHHRCRRRAIPAEHLRVGGDVDWGPGSRCTDRRRPP